MITENRSRNGGSSKWLQFGARTGRIPQVGAVQITIHESNVVQIGRIEMTRLERLKKQT